MTTTVLVPLPTLLPLVGAGLALALFRYPRAQRAISFGALAAMLVVSAALAVVVENGPLAVGVGGWAAPVGVGLVIDRLAALLLTVSAVVMLCVLTYSLAQGAVDDPGVAASDRAASDRQGRPGATGEARPGGPAAAAPRRSHAAAAVHASEDLPVAIYHPTFLVLAAGVSLAFCSGDLFNLYVGFEVLLAASFVLLTLSGTSERIRAGAIYVVVALLSSIVFLLAIGLAYAATGTVNLAQLALRLAEIDPGVRLTIELLLLLAFAVKAAVFPLSAWLPDSYPTAPAPVTAVFAGLLTKVGVYAILRTQTLLVPAEGVDTVLMVFALATMLVGILGAVAQTDLKRLFSFTLVSHIGFMIFGIGLATEAGRAAAVFYVVHHITVQTTLFLVAGLVERRAGSTSLARLGGLAGVAPGLAVLFGIPALSLAGVPPLSGFLGKLGLLQGGVAVGTPMAWTLVVGSVVTSLLTLYALVKAWNKAFWQAPPAAPAPRARLPRGMVGGTAVLCAAGLAMTVWAGPLYGYAQRAAVGLDDGSYIEAVFPGGAPRGVGSSDEAAARNGSGPAQDGAP